MKDIFKSMILFAVIALVLAITIPNFIVGSNALADTNSKGSTIGGVEVGKLKGEELVNVLTDAVNEWYAQPITVFGGGSSIEVSTNTFQFDIEGTVKSYEQNYTKKWYELWASNGNVHLPLTIQPSEFVKNEISNMPSWNTELTYEKVELNASYLKTDNIEAVVEDLLALENERIALSVQSMPKGANGIQELVLALNETVIESNATFSMLESLEEVIHLANNETVNFIASNVYYVALLSDGEILERHSQNSVPNYLKPGLEAKVSNSKNEDLKFLNTLATPIKLKLSIEEENLIAEAYTTSKKSNASVSVSRDEVITPRTIIRYSDDLSVGQVQQLQEGEEGLRVSVFRTMEGEQNLVSRDYYPPINRVLLKSSHQPEAKNESKSVFKDSDLEIDLDGDGFTDEELITDDSINSEDELPPGSYYDKGGNIITPDKGED